MLRSKYSKIKYKVFYNFFYYLIKKYELIDHFSGRVGIDHKAVKISYFWELVGKIHVPCGSENSEVL